MINTLIFGHFDNFKLAPLYKKVFSEYMDSSEDNIMFFEASQFPDTVGVMKMGMVFDLGFKTPPGGEIGSKNHVLNDHSYCCQLDLSICKETGEPQKKDE